MIPVPFRRILLATAALAPTLLFPSCIFTDGPTFGGFSSIATDPMGALEAEPPDVKPNSHIDPVIQRRGAFSLTWTEDLTKSSNNNEPDPDEMRERR